MRISALLALFLITGSSFAQDEPPFIDENAVFPSHIFIPNVISANCGYETLPVHFSSGDSIVAFDLSVYYRWGEELFASTEANKCWEPFAPGKDTPDGSYVWSLMCTNVEGVTWKHRGHVTVLR